MSSQPASGSREASANELSSGNTHYPALTLVPIRVAVPDYAFSLLEVDWLDRLMQMPSKGVPYRNAPNELVETSTALFTRKAP